MQEKVDMYQKMSIETIQELEAKDEQIKKLKKDLHSKISGMCRQSRHVVRFVKHFS